jgi:hypothetical protein
VNQITAWYSGLAQHSDMRQAPLPFDFIIPGQEPTLRELMAQAGIESSSAEDRRRRAQRRQLAEPAPQLQGRVEESPGAPTRIGEAP